MLSGKELLKKLKTVCSKLIFDIKDWYLKRSKDVEIDVLLSDEGCSNYAIDDFGATNLEAAVENAISKLYPEASVSVDFNTNTYGVFIKNPSFINLNYDDVALNIKDIAADAMIDWYQNGRY